MLDRNSMGMAKVQIISHLPQCVYCSRIIEIEAKHWLVITDNFKAKVHICVPCFQKLGEPEKQLINKYFI